MTKDLGFPSTDFPGPPPFRFAIPKGWRAVPSVEADAVVVGPEAIDGVHPNVVITNHKVRASDDPATALRNLVDQQLSRPEIIEGDDITFVGSDGRACSVRLTRRAGPTGNGETAEHGDGDSNGDTVVSNVTIGQSLNLCYIPGEFVAHVLAATGTYAATGGASRDTVESVIKSIRY